MLFRKRTFADLYESILTYSFDSDCKYKDFIENQLNFGHSFR